MKKLLLILLCLPMIFSCGEDKKVTAEKQKKAFIENCEQKSAKANGPLANVEGVYVKPNQSIIDYCKCCADEIFDNSSFSVQEMQKMDEATLSKLREKWKLKCKELLPIYQIKPDWSKTKVFVDSLIRLSTDTIPLLNPDDFDQVIKE